MPQDKKSMGRAAVQPPAAGEGIALPVGGPDLAGLQPIERIRRRWPMVLGAVLTLLMVVGIGRELLDDGIAPLRAVVPASPWFWVAFAAFYLTPPTIDYVIFRRLWGIPLSGMIALHKKRIANDVVMGYSGEAFFYAWARQRVKMVAAPFGAVKDVAILSAIAGNGVTLLVTLLALPLALGLLDPGEQRTLALSVAVLFPAWSGLSAATAAPIATDTTLPDVSGWTRVGQGGAVDWTPSYPGADRLLQARYVDAAGRTVDLAVAVYAVQGEGREIVGHGIGAIPPESTWLRVENRPPLAGGAVIRMRAPGPVERDTATWYRLGDMVTASARRVKIETVRSRLTGGDPGAVAVIVSAEREGQDARRAMEDFVAAAGPIARVADRVAGAR